MKKIGFILLLTVAILSGCSEKNDRAAAIVSAKMFVEDNLKSPDSADFCWDNDANQQSDGSWIVSGCVDAENGFGAEIRADWEVEEVYNEETEKWELLDISINER